jgi:8-oxo-dGTP pyrophosphatase MutT (NUDIX family)
MPERPMGPTATRIRQEFARTSMPDDPGRATFPEGAEHWSQSMRDRMSGRLTPAGVLIPIIERSGGMMVLLTERSPDLKHHAGQVSFPGGRMEGPDLDIRSTALRETHEEVGIDPHHVEVAGYLETTATVTGYAVTPVLGFVNPEVELIIDPVEVKTAFEVPLNFLLEERNQLHSQREFEGHTFPMISFEYDNQNIWGATAGILLSLREKLLKYP